VVRLEVGKRVVVILPCLHAGERLEEVVDVGHGDTRDADDVFRLQCVDSESFSRVTAVDATQPFFKRYTMRHTPFCTRRRSLHGSWRPIEGAAECKDSDQHEIRTSNKANYNSKNGDDQDVIVCADGGGRRRTFRRLSGRYGIVQRSSWA
jgi:hypothetical protein